MRIPVIGWRRPVALLLAALALLAGGAVRAEAPAEYQVKAVLLFNLTRYTTWPAEVLEGRTEFRLCAFGSDPFQGSLELAVKGEDVKGLPVRVSYPKGADEIAGCHLLFLGAATGQAEPQVLRRIAQSPILTVGESEEFIFNGGMVRFYSQGSKVRFAINPNAVNAAGLKVSANLLRIANIVRTPALVNRSEP